MSRPSTLPPPPPPPPPTITYSATASHGQESASNTEHTVNENVYFRMEPSEPVSQLQEIYAVIARELGPANADDSVPVASVPAVVYSPISHVFLQQGPTCGIVALEIAGALMDAVAKTNDRKYGGILEIAIKEGFTKKGEMFSVDDMSQLAAKIFPELRATVSCTDGDFWKELLQAVFSGNVVLMPYDADRNHSPALRKGHNAHWAVIHGAIFINPVKSNLEIGQPGAQENLGTVETSLGHKVILIDPKKTTGLNVHNISDATGVYTLAHQGKSAHVGVWNLRDLLESNQNLHGISPKLLEEESGYVLRDIVTNLNGRAVVLSRSCF